MDNEKKEAGMKEETPKSSDLSGMEQKKMKSSTKVLIVVAVVLGILTLIGIGLVFAVLSVVKTAVDEYESNPALTEDFDFDSEFDSLFGDTDVTPEQAAMINDLLDQYDLVVAATDDSVPWSTYLDELDALIIIMEELYVSDPDPALGTSIDLMSEAFITYVLSVDESTNEVTDPDGVDEAFNGVTAAEQFLFDYLEERGY